MPPDPPGLMRVPPPGLELRVSEYLAGSSIAVKKGDLLLVSPSLYSLIKSERGAALDRLIRSIRYLEMPENAWVTGVTRPQGWPIIEQWAPPAHKARVHHPGA